MGKVYINSYESQFREILRTLVKVSIRLKNKIKVKVRFRVRIKIQENNLKTWQILFTFYFI